MKYLILIMFPLFAHGQLHTIFKKNGSKLLGTIDTITEMKIFFKNEKGFSDSIQISKVSKYVISNKIPKISPPIKRDSMPLNAMANYYTMEDIQYMKDCFKQCHKSYSLGVGLSIVGILFSFIGISSDIRISNSKSYLLYGGLGLSLIGSIVIIDSHKWIGRAGMNHNGFGVNIKMK